MTLTQLTHQGSPDESASKLPDPIVQHCCKAMLTLFFLFLTCHVLALVFKTRQFVAEVTHQLLFMTIFLT